MTEKQELQAVVQGNNLFTSQLYSILAKKSGNVFFSPISAYAVLSMAFQGAKGKTYEAFIKTLNMPDSNVTAKGCKSVIEYLNNVSNIELLIANKMYVMQGISLKPEFNDVTQNKFLSKVEAVNFGDASNAARNINQWVEERTKHKIKDFISPTILNASTKLVLVNAIYFKGNWAAMFDAKQTKTDKFYLNDNESVEVQMMSNKADYLYIEDKNLDAKVLGMPYSNEYVHLFVFLPNKRNGIAALEKKLAVTELTKIIENTSDNEVEVQVKLPKFRTESTNYLNDALTQLGLGVIFEANQADFSGMLTTSEKLNISNVIQKAFIEVNEEGTEAAAATGLTIGFYSAPLVQAPPRTFTADHPFIIMLQVKHSNIFPILLLAGRISNPL